MRKFLGAMISVLFAAHGAAFAQTATIAKPTPILSTATSASTSTVPNTSTSSKTTRRPADTGEIYRWVDKNGKVQYSADVPEERRATAKKVDTRSNIVSSRIPASIGVAQPSPPSTSNAAPGNLTPGSAPQAAQQPRTAREKCEAAWAEYRAAEQCFAQYRQTTVGGAGNKAGSRVSAEALDKCPSLSEPAACR